MWTLVVWSANAWKRVCGIHPMVSTEIKTQKQILGGHFYHIVRKFFIITQQNYSATSTLVCFFLFVRWYKAAMIIAQHFASVCVCIPRRSAWSIDTKNSSISLSNKGVQEFKQNTAVRYHNIIRENNLDTFWHCKSNQITFKHYRNWLKRFVLTLSAA